MGMPTVTVSQVNLTAHIETLKAKRDTVHNFCSALQAGISHITGPTNAHNVGTMLESLLAFDLDQAIKTCEAQQAEQISREPQILLSLCEQREFVKRQIQQFDTDTGRTKISNPDIGTAMEPVYKVQREALMSNLAQVEHAIAGLQKQIKSRE